MSLSVSQTTTPSEMPRNYMETKLPHRRHCADRWPLPALVLSPTPSGSDIQKHLLMLTCTFTFIQSSRVHV